MDHVQFMDTINPDDVLDLEFVNVLILISDAKPMLATFKPLVESHSMKHFLESIGVSVEKSEDFCCVLNKDPILSQIRYVVTVGYNTHPPLMLRLYMYNILKEAELSDYIDKNCKNLKSAQPLSPAPGKSSSFLQVARMKFDHKQVNSPLTKSFLCQKPRPLKLRADSPVPSPSKASYYISTNNNSPVGSARKSYLSRLPPFDVSVKRNLAKLWLNQCTLIDLLHVDNDDYLDPFTYTTDNSITFFRNMIENLELQRFVDCYFAFIDDTQGKAIVVERFGAHRCMLGEETNLLARSVYRSLEDPVEISIKDIKPAIFKKFIRIIYRDNVKVANIDEAFALHKVARKFGCSKVKQIIQDLTREIA